MKTVLSAFAAVSWFVLPMAAYAQTAPTAPNGAAWGTTPAAPTANGGVTAQAPAPKLAAAPPPVALPPGSRLVPTGDGGFVVVAAPPPAAPQPAPRAEPDSDAEPVAPSHAAQKKRVWYGWQTLIVDGAGLLIATAAYSSNDPSDSFAGVSVLTYGVGAPIVHAAHGEGIRSLASIGLRGALPAVTSLLAYGLAGADYQAEDAAVGGLVIGALGAIALDAGVLAYEETCSCGTNKVTTHERDAKKSMFQIMPTLGARRQGGTIGLTGTF